MTRKARSLAGLGFLVLGAVLIAGAAGWHLYNQSQETHAQENAYTVLTTMEEEFVKQDLAVPEEVVLQKNDPTRLDFQSAPSPLAEMPILVVDGTAYVGAIQLPTLGLELPVADVWSDNLLKLAPCRYAGSVYSHDMVIAGHNYVTHFANLKQLTPGDPVHFLDMDQVLYTYTVTQLELVSPTEIEAMTTPDHWDLTLFTCTPDGQSRIAVRCVQDAKA